MSDPTVQGNGQLAWQGPFTVTNNDTLQLHFSVTLPGPISTRLRARSGGFLRLGDGTLIRQNTSIRLSRTDTSQCV